MTDDREQESGVHWLVRRRTVRILAVASTVALLVTSALGALVGPQPHFGIDGIPLFYSWYGFLTCVGMVVFAKLLGIFLKRRDNYYDD